MSTPATLFPYPEDGTATRGDLIATLNKAVAKIYSASASATAAYTGLEELRSTTRIVTDAYLKFGVQQEYQSPHRNPAESHN